MLSQSPTPEPLTLIDLLRLRSATHPDRGYKFLRDGEGELEQRDYRDLYRKARAIAAHLSRACRPGDRALLLYPPGLDFIDAFFGCLCAGVVAVPAYPPRPNRSLRRLQAITADAGPTLALTEGDAARADGIAALGVPVLRTGQLPETDGDSWQPPPVTPCSLAMLQYTSGSTYSPRGVMVTHANLLHNQRLIREVFEHTDQSVVLGWLPLFHDMGLIGSVLQPLYIGCACVLMAPLHFLQSPLRWLRAIDRFRATTSGGPNFAYDLCVEKCPPEQCASLDLSSWRVAFNGSEPVRARTLQRFTEAFASNGFRLKSFLPCYGLAEATLLVTGAAADRAPTILSVDPAVLGTRDAAVPVPTPGGVLVVGCGRAPEQRLAIVDPHGQEASEGRVGEICVSGPSVALGYWNRPEQTRETFHYAPAGLSDTSFVRTGDLGFVSNGELFFTCRLKDLIILRGRNHHPQDIEQTVGDSHSGLRRDACAAFSVAVEDEERLVIVQEWHRSQPIEPEEVFSCIRRAVLREHEVNPHTIVLIRPASLPRTSSGKVQRFECEAAFLAGTLREVARDAQPLSPPGTEEPEAEFADLTSGPAGRQRLLCRLLAGVLRCSPSDLDPSRPLDTLGLDSLAAIQVQHEMESQLGVAVPLALLLQTLTIAELAERLPGLPPTSTAEPAVDRPDEVEQPLSSGQQALWLLDRMAPGSATCSITRAARVRGPVDAPALERTLRRLQQRHPCLRAVFPVRAGQPVQRTLEVPPLCFSLEDASDWSDQCLLGRLTHESQRLFDLEHGPLLRVTLFMLGPQDSVLLFSVHHLVADFWSIAVLLDELGVLYSAECLGEPATLPDLPARYSDYVRWQEDLVAGPEGERQRAYWSERLAGEPARLALPADLPRPAAPSMRGGSHAFELSRETTVALLALAQSVSATPYVVLLAALQSLLYRYTGQEDFFVGSPVAGRSRAGFAGLVGYFVNLVPIRADLSGDPTFRALVSRVQRAALEALEHQDYPFPRLLQRHRPGRDVGRAPLFQVLFTYQQAHQTRDQRLAAFALGLSGPPVPLAGLTLEALPVADLGTQFDLDLALAQQDGVLLGRLKYSTELFEPATMARLAGHYQALLACAVANPDRPLSRLSLLSPEERRQVLSWGQPARCYPDGPSLHQQFAAQARLHPEQPRRRLRRAHPQLRPTGPPERPAGSPAGPAAARRACRRAGGGAGPPPGRAGRPRPGLPGLPAGDAEVRPRAAAFGPRAPRRLAGRTARRLPTPRPADRPRPSGPCPGPGLGGGLRPRRLPGPPGA